ncbi:TonB-dependent receptor domain-containing protein [Xenorhabdus griffiniae]|uniref:TonB-dependent receptor n=1 Tax=Xenorhabdus griffiniae TaxID=351672 RepID=A0ABY9XHT3_9GAMM|nr:TonB-dependent receptor [Xenorhabdus griffiniae]MBD1227077.1 TonB-dependent receptor [Xenorhabdus griffiniae]MBE8587059.1 TonB-dependent receptor [Xenorhabdus griffiniae]WMV72494.1 TonB-dependent receptor [Xenorhabdus griffiniae]WNH02172.1 TonB-dependent receptor [Xenorhabdus griffiniae]
MTYRIKTQFTPTTIALSLALSLIAPPLFAESKPTATTSNSKTDLGKIRVTDNSDKDEEGYNAVYDKDISNIYIGKEQIERYKGASPADLIKGAVGVYSGDARNSGALDVNIRGVQGQGRIPITIDGTEQAITVGRGYNGANNRNYIDPNLISSIEIEKGPSLNRKVKGSIGGAVSIKTLTIDDVVPKGETFGINTKLETSSNSVRERTPSLQLGQDYRDIPNFIQNKVETDPELQITPHSSKDNKLFGFKDNAFRIALGTRQEYFDLMLAYAYRRQGNYFAGKGGAHRYDEPITENDRELMKNVQTTLDPYLPFAARIYRPGNEVPNTSSEMRSVLIKNTWRFTEDQVLQLGIRNTHMEFGDIMPSRLGWVIPEENKVPQWPLAKVLQKAANLTYKWQPENNPYVDFDMNLWTTRTTSNTNTAGGYPRTPVDRDWRWEDGLEGRNANIDGTLINTAITHSQNNRWGVDLSNKFTLHPSLELTLMGNFQRERLDSNDDYDSPNLYFDQSPTRKGQRQEINLAFNFNWRPASWLELNAGAKRVSYWSQDDLLNERRAVKDSRYQKQPETIGHEMSYWRTITETESNMMKKRKQFIRSNNSLKMSSAERIEFMNKLQTEYPVVETTRIDSRDGLKRNMVREKFTWKYDPSNGKLSKSGNPYFNGQLDMNEKVIDPISGKEVYKYEYGERADATGVQGPAVDDLWETAPKRKDHAWAPTFSATAYVTDDFRIYARYAEAVRMPSIFEDTVGFSGSPTNQIGHKFKPERAKTAEVGLVYDFSQLVEAERHADIKLSYYNTLIENVFDRDTTYKFSQLDKQKLAGLELQARYDNGSFFADMGLVYNMKNKVCDNNSVMRLDSQNRYGIPECIDGGFPGGYLRTSIQPKYSANLSVGGRLFDEKLELGSRILYHSKAENKDEKWLMNALPDIYKGQSNNPMRWNPVFTVDAYINYQITPTISIELTGTNLTNRYYLDPLTRSMIPAPGRTFKLSLTSQF